MNLIETGILLVFWNNILERFQATQASVQAKQQSLSVASALCASLLEFLRNLRVKFDEFESEAQTLTHVQEYRQTKKKRRIIRNQRCDEDIGSGRLVPDAGDNQSPDDRFRIKVFCVVLDSLHNHRWNNVVRHIPN